MSRCPFLSTFDNKVSCFKECPFHECKDNDGCCPFKALSTNKMLKKNHFYKYNELQDDNISVLDDIYQQNNYLKFFQI
ncbi:hypothetical protein [Clostridium ganghwense]|uniref:Uncharacterized protein n=1 Tax=Clostridium ganghwense TaxID=312089 RepID=A0ABT4CP90_9CLOT|nr:hypothetical protein [Clostridium ganghwense]MCY6370862.1 hypothetical protein [Clostridium ganghwense]